MVLSVLEQFHNSTLQLLQLIQWADPASKDMYNQPQQHCDLI